MKVSDKSLYFFAAVFLVLVLAVSVSSDVIEMMCFDDIGCGPTGFVGEEYCSDNMDMVYKDFQTSVCLNPGQDDSVCEIIIEPILISNCDDEDPMTLDSCVEGDDVYCHHEFVGCVDDSDCEQGYCDENNLCVFDEVECLIDETCGAATSEFICLDDDLYEETITPICSEGHSCDVDVSQDFVEACEFGCVAGECEDEPVVCVDNSDCGDESEELYCQGSDVYVEITTPVCGENECSVITESEFVEDCDEDCNDGECVRERFDRDNNFFDEGDEAFFEALMMGKSRGQNVVPQYILLDEMENETRQTRSVGDYDWLLFLILGLVVLLFIFLLVLYLAR